MPSTLFPIPVHVVVGQSGSEGEFAHWKALSQVARISYVVGMVYSVVRTVHAPPGAEKCGGMPTILRVVHPMRLRARCVSCEAPHTQVVECRTLHPMRGETAEFFLSHRGTGRGILPPANGELAAEFFPAVGRPAAEFMLGRRRKRPRISSTGCRRDGSRRFLPLAAGRAGRRILPFACGGMGAADFFRLPRAGLDAEFFHSPRAGLRADSSYPQWDRPRNSSTLRAVGG
jgi:hypothetical protein